MRARVWLAQYREIHASAFSPCKQFVRTEKVVRSPAGKADYRWAKAVAVEAAAAEKA